MATKKKASTSGQRLNRELLERARQQAREIEAEDAEAEAAETETDSLAQVSFAAAPETARREPARAPASSAGASRRASTAKRLREKNEESRKKSMTSEEISEILAHPTKFVSEGELHAQYGFVLRDLRNMAMLAAASFLVLVVLAVLLPQ